MNCQKYFGMNYHTHTTLCRHATGTEREYIEAAIKAGMHTLGFSDHIPLPPGYDYGRIMGVRMRSEEAWEYVSTLKALRDEYKNDIRILIGFEGEYFRSCFDAQMDFMDSLGCDYLILGQHFLPRPGDFCYVGMPTSDEAVLKEYVDSCIEGLKTGRYSYLAHPDLIDFTGDTDVYAAEMTRLCRFCSDNGIPLEINLHGFLEKRNYPCKPFFRIASEAGSRILFGVDAHSPDEIGNLHTLAAALDLVSHCGLTVMDEFI